MLKILVLYPYTMTIDTEEKRILKMSEGEILTYCFSKCYLQRFQLCPGTCKEPMTLAACKTFSEGKCWRCYTSGCSKQYARRSIRFNSFFETITTDIRTVLRILLRIEAKQQQSSIISTLKLSKPTMSKLKNLLVERMHNANRALRKLGGAGTYVQVDETMLNYKCKSHRGRSSNYKTDAICIVEVADRIAIAWVEVIDNKKATTLLPIIQSHVLPDTVIHRDEHKSYSGLQRLGYEHNTVFHRYNFVEPLSGVHTQHVESFNNALKYEVKRGKAFLRQNDLLF